LQLIALNCTFETDIFLLAIMKKILILFAFLSVLSVRAQSQAEWVNEQYEAMTLDEKIGQLFMVAAYSNKNENHVKDLEQLVENKK